MDDTLHAAPAAYATLTPAPVTVRTRLRVHVSDDGPMPRLHLRLPTTAGTVDVALAPDAAAQLLAGLRDAVADLDSRYTPTLDGAA